jgi:hypothetical protein
VKKILIGLMVAVLLTLGLVSPMMADTAQNVTVTATPAYVSIANDLDTWTLNGVIGDGFILTDTIYYSVDDDAVSDTTTPAATVNSTSCRFTLTDTSGVNITLKVTMENFAGGDADMTNSGLGSNGAADYGAYSYYTGCTYGTDKQIVKEGADIATTGVLYTSTVAGGADIGWGVGVETQTDAWAGSTPSTAQLTITAAKA